jgi:hopanoid biosynthesis associated protein HpnK
VRRLIINADDFGLTAGVNRAIMKAHFEGVVTSATLMANGPAFDEAVTRAASAPHLGVGCHVAVLDGSSLLGPSQVPTLIEGQQSSRFYQESGAFAWRTVTGRIHPAEIELETVAQIRKLQSSGIPVTHIDTHKHMHILPQVLRPLLRAAQTCGVRKIRNPFEPLRLAGLIRHPGLWKRWIEFRTLSTLSHAFRQSVKNAGLLTTDGTIGIVATGALDEKLLHTLVENLPDGTWEFVCHPGCNDSALQSLQTRLRKSREQELGILTAPATRELLQRNHIELISYHDLT